jgi:hypothetical protein
MERNLYLIKRSKCWSFTYLDAAWGIRYFEEEINNLRYFVFEANYLVMQMIHSFLLFYSVHE